MFIKLDARGITLAVVMLFTCLFVDESIACETCADRGVIETRTTCKGCSGTAKIAKTLTSMCPNCSGSGKQTVSKREGGLYQGTFCRVCRGTGVDSTTKWSWCTQCSGAGIQVLKVVCPSCKGASVLNSLDQTTTGSVVTPTVNLIAVETCKQCDTKGNLSSTITIVCENCEKGWNHLKNNQGTYDCRSCGAIKESRYSPCKCAKPDCVKCKGKYEKTTTVTCTLCGGDKMITPLEREKLQKKEEIK